MKFAIFVATAVGAAAISVFAVPASFVGSATDELHGLAVRSGVANFRLVDLNPLRAVFDYEQQQINRPLTPEQLGLHATPMTLSPMALTPPQSLKLNLGQSFDPQAKMEIEQNNRHLEDLRNYGRDPTHWVGPPPN